MIDSHCHLDMFEDLEEVLERAARAGVEKILTISTNLKEMEILKGICQRFPKRVAMTLGIHPEEIADVKDEEILEAFAIIPTQSCILGVGKSDSITTSTPPKRVLCDRKMFFVFNLSWLDPITSLFLFIRAMPSKILWRL